MNFYLLSYTIQIILQGFFINHSESQNNVIRNYIVINFHEQLVFANSI